MLKFEYVTREISADYPTTITYNAKKGGYHAVTKVKGIRVVVPDAEGYYKYMAGQRDHLFPEFDPKIHITNSGSWQPEVTSYEGIPITLSEIVHDKSVSIPYGCFHLLESNEGPFLKQFSVSTDGYINLGRDEYNDVYRDFSAFREERSLYESERKRHRSSALLYGPPGNGKTREICRILQDAEKEKFRAIFIGSGIKNLMSLEPFRKPLDEEDKVFVIEEITERTKNTDMADQLLSFLDGELSWNHSFTIATTNYPELLEMNIVDRPGRFKTVVEVTSPNHQERLKYLVGSGLTEEIATVAAKLTQGLSLDYLSSIVFDYKRTGKSFDRLLREMKENREKTARRFKVSGNATIGLGSAPSTSDAKSS